MRNSFEWTGFPSKGQQLARGAVVRGEVCRRDARTTGLAGGTHGRIGQDWNMVRRLRMRGTKIAITPKGWSRLGSRERMGGFEQAQSDALREQLALHAIANLTS